MSRSLRFIPPGGALVEVTCRTLQGRFLLRPGERANRRILGVLGRALRRHPTIEMHAYVFLSNHYHLLLTTPDAHELAAFMNFLNGNIARELGRLYRWSEKFWASRYRAILVSDESEQQVARVVYLLEQGCKEGLVESPRQWPGVSWVRAILSGEREFGFWRRRTAESEAKRKGRRVSRSEFLDREEVPLHPLPCWKHLGEEQYREAVREQVVEVERRTQARHQEEQTQPLGSAKVMRQMPHRRPKNPKHEPAPQFHGSCRVARERLREAYRAFVEAYRSAVSELRAGNRNARFPPGAFLPPLPIQAPG